MPVMNAVPGKVPLSVCDDHTEELLVEVGTH